MKNSLKGINSKLDTVEEEISKGEYIALETIQNEHWGEKRMKQNCISELWKMWSNVHVIGFCKEKEIEEGTKKF